MGIYIPKYKKAWYCSIIGEIRARVVINSRKCWSWCSKMNKKNSFLWLYEIRAPVRTERLYLLRVKNVIFRELLLRVLCGKVIKSWCNLDVFILRILVIILAHNGQEIGFLVSHFSFLGHYWGHWEYYFFINPICTNVLLD